MPKVKKININKILQKAIIAHENNSFQKAEKLYKQILETDPTQPEANHGFGILCTQFNNLELAIHFFEQALQFDPQNQQYQHSLATTKEQLKQSAASKQHHNNEQLTLLFNQQKYDEAIKLAQKAVKDDPSYFFGWKIIGTIEILLQEYKNAYIHLQKAISLNPNDPETYYNLGIVLEKLNNLKDAETSYRQATQLNPSFVAAHNNLGIVLKNLKRSKEAEISLREAIRLKPDHVEAYNNLGNALKNLGRFEEAEMSLREAIRLKPDHVEAYNNLGNVLKSLGKLAKAEEYYREAIHLNPHYAEAHNNLGITLENLGRLTEAEASYCEAIRLKPNYAEAHRSLSTLLKYTPKTLHLQQLIEVYDKTEKVSDKYHIGFALAKAYEDIKEYDTSFFYLEKANRLKFEESQYDIEKIKTKFQLIQSFFKDISINQTKKKTSKDKQPIFILGMPRSGTTLTEQILSSHPLVYGCGELEYLHHILSKENFSNSNLLSHSLENLCKKYMDKIEKLAFKEKIFTDKMPHNFIYIGFILESFPNAKIIHMERDPMAICWSMYKQYFPAEDLNYCYNFNTLAKFYELYKDIMDFWNKLYPEKIYNLQYETLTENQEEEIRKLLKYCNLSWANSVLEPHKNKRAVETASNQQIRKKIYTGSSKDWKKFEKYLKPLQEKLLQSKNY